MPPPTVTAKQFCRWVTATSRAHLGCKTAEKLKCTRRQLGEGWWGGGGGLFSMMATPKQRLAVLVGVDAEPPPGSGGPGVRASSGSNRAGQRVDMEDTKGVDGGLQASRPPNIIRG